jgi:beta-lactamase class A
MHAMRPRALAPLPVILFLAAVALVGCARSSRSAAVPVPPPDPAAELIRLLESSPVESAPGLAPAAPAPRHAKADEMLASSNDGRWGYLLRDVGGPDIARAGADELFEPASTIKTICLLHALREVDAGAVTLATEIPWYRASTVADDPATPNEDEREWGCPLDADPATGELGAGLRAMMERSDNRWTLAVRRYFGDDRILATAREAGMGRTVLRHRLGCAETTDGDPGQLDAPNASTLDELCGMVEQVAAGRLLSPERAAAFFEIMDNDPLVRLTAVFEEENAAVGLPADLLAAVVRRQELAWKSGKYNIGEYKCQSVVGLAGFVSWADGSLLRRRYVFGVFVDDARRFPEQGTRASLYSLAVASELMREPVREVLRSFRRALDVHAGG